MKKELVLVMIMLVTMCLVLAGCVEETKIEKVNSSVELLKPQQSNTELAKQWLALYGDDLESVEHYNIALQRLELQRTVRMLNKQGKYIIGLTDPNDFCALEDRVEAMAGRAKELAYTIGLEVGELQVRVEQIEATVGKIVIDESVAKTGMTEAEKEAGWDDCWTNDKGERVCKAAIMRDPE